MFLATGAQQLSGKVLSAMLCVSLFVVLGFEHSVANMFLIPHGMLGGAPVSTGQYLLANLVPVTIGNVLGGAAFALVMWFGHGRK